MSFTIRQFIIFVSQISTIVELETGDTKAKGQGAISNVDTLKSIGKSMALRKYGIKQEGK